MAEPAGPAAKRASPPPGRLVHRLRRARHSALRALRAAGADAAPLLLLGLVLCVAARALLSGPPDGGGGGGGRVGGGAALRNSPSFQWRAQGGRGVGGAGGAGRVDAVEVHDAMPSASPWPAEAVAPDPGLYGRGAGRCFVLGDGNGGGAGGPVWRVNSRALCYEGGPVCFSGRALESVGVFEARGTGRCDVVGVETGVVRRAGEAEMEGSCARLRERRVVAMFGSEAFLDAAALPPDGDADGAGGRVGVRWVGGRRAAESSELAIIVPKYDWSWNICHYNRIWQNVLYVIRHLRLFVEDAGRVAAVTVYFRAKHPYDDVWTAGIREATLPALRAETGLNVTVAKLRYAPAVDCQCVRRAILLGAEGRVDAYPFLNDSAVWEKGAQDGDDHVPHIPHEALWLRTTVYASFGLPPPGTLAANGDYATIPVPPLVVVHLARNPRSRRRLLADSAAWFDDTLATLAAVHGFEVRHVRCNATIPLSQQAGALRGVGLAVGIHGANLVNTMFMPAAAALFEVFPYRYVRYYYASGANSGLRYSFHEVTNGVEHTCRDALACMFKYRESHMDLGDRDRRVVAARLERAMRYVRGLHEAFPTGQIPLQRRGNVYSFDRRAVYSA